MLMLGRLLLLHVLMLGRLLLLHMLMLGRLLLLHMMLGRLLASGRLSALERMPALGVRFNALLQLRAGPDAP
jgi:hypothetical protein